MRRLRSRQRRPTESPGLVTSNSHDFLTERAIVRGQDSLDGAMLAPAPRPSSCAARRGQVVISLRSPTGSQWGNLQIAWCCGASGPDWYVCPDLRIPSLLRPTPRPPSQAQSDPTHIVSDKAHPPTLRHCAEFPIPLNRGPGLASAVTRVPYLTYKYLVPSTSHRCLCSILSTRDTPAGSSPRTRVAGAANLSGDRAEAKQGPTGHYGCQGQLDHFRVAPNIGTSIIR